MPSDKPTPAPPQPSARSLLDLLTKTRLVEVGRDFGVAVPPSATKEVQVERLAASGHGGFSDLLRSLSRDELRAACRGHGLDKSSRSRPEPAPRGALGAGVGAGGRVLQPLWAVYTLSALLEETGPLLWISAGSPAPWYLQPGDHR